MFKDRPLGVPEHGQHKLSSRGLRLEFFGRRWRVLPLHALPFGFWFIMMNPCFIPSDDAIQELIAFTIVPLQKTGADVLAVALMLCQVWAPTLQQLCGTQECHALKNRPYLDRCPVVTRFLLLSQRHILPENLQVPSNRRRLSTKYPFSFAPFRIFLINAEWCAPDTDRYSEVNFWPWLSGCRSLPPCEPCLENVRSFSSLSYDRSKASSKASCPHSAI